jgi:GT2 family glycosyltransferase
MAIAAVVVSHDNPDSAAATIAAVDSQTLKPDLFIAVGEFPTGSLADHWDIVQTPDVSRKSKSLQARLISAAIDALPYGFAQDEESWIWLLTEDSVPEATALAELAHTIEAAPSAALVGPKLVRLDSPRIIEQMGLTLTRDWRMFSSVSAEFDQSQHDETEDVLAVATTGALINASRYLSVLGLRQNLSALAADYDLAMRMRLAGFRVLLAPLSKVAVGAKTKNILLSSRSTIQQRKAQIELLSIYQPAPVAFLLGFFAPLIAILQSIWLLLVKRPERIWPTLRSGIWWFFTLPAQLSHRSAITRDQRRGTAKLGVLFASREDINRSYRSKVEAVTDTSGSSNETGISLIGSGGLWVMALVAVLSWRFWPTNVAVVGGSTLPLSGDFGAVFSHTAASWQALGLGLAAPSDPFNWVLLAFAACTYWAPTVSLTIFFFLAKSLAWAGAWQALKLATSRKSLVFLGATVYAFWPALTQAQTQGQIGSLVALVLLPYFVFGLAKVLRIGSTTNQTWTWVGVSALLAAAISASSPGLTPLLALVILLLAIYRFKRVGYLMWLPVPLLVLWIPSALFLTVGLGHPLALLSDPGLPVASEQKSIWQLLMAAPSGAPLAEYSGYALVVFLAVGLAAIWRKRANSALGLWLAFIAATAAAWAFNQIRFQAPTSSETGQDWVAGSPTALLGLSGLLAAFLVVIALDNSKGVLAALGKGASWIVAGALAIQFALTPTIMNHTDGKLVPALVAAQASAHPATRVLQIEPIGLNSAGQVFGATLITGPGLHLDDLNTGYRFALSGLSAKNANYRELSQLVANLVSANGADLAPALKKFSIDFVTVTQLAASDVASSLDTVKELEPVGVTDTGRLWRVTDAAIPETKVSNPWSITRLVQIFVLAIFILLALPTRRKSKTAAAGDPIDALESGDGEGDN